MLTYTFWDYFLTTIISWFIGFLFYCVVGIALYGVIALVLYWTGRLASVPSPHVPMGKLIYLRQEHMGQDRPGDLEEVQE